VHILYTPITGMEYIYILYKRLYVYLTNVPIYIITVNNMERK